MAVISHDARRALLFITSSFAGSENLVIGGGGTDIEEFILFLKSCLSDNGLTRYLPRASCSMLKILWGCPTS